MFLPAHSRRALRCALVILASAALVAAGCGGDDDTPIATEEPVQETDEQPAQTEALNRDDPDGDSDDQDETNDPSAQLAQQLCAFFNPAGISEIVGERVGTPQLQGRTCSVRAADSVSTARVSVEVLNEPGGFEAKRESLGVDEELPDIGDEAFLSGTTVVIRSGDMIMVTNAQADLGGDTVVDPADVVYMADLLASLVF